MATKMENVQVNLNVDDCKTEAASFVNPYLSDLSKMDSRETALEMDKLVLALKVGKALNAARSIFKQNGHKLGGTFEPWAQETLKKSRASVHMYMKLDKNRDKFEAIATSIKHAHDILCGKCDENGDYLEKEPTIITDADIIAKILKQVAKLENFDAGISEIRKGLSDLKRNHTEK